MSEERRDFQVGGMWEDREWYVLFNKPSNESCPHTIPCPEDKKRVGNMNYRFICPRVVMAENEGGYNSTGICLDCILDAAVTLR